MGRYYSGDIEGKFVFAKQSSSAADRFGVAGHTPGYLEYYYDESNLPGLLSELKEIENSFGEHKMAIKAYHDLHGVDSHDLREYMTTAELPEMPKERWDEYYDYLIGIKILDCIERTGECNFQAEL